MTCRVMKAVLATALAGFFVPAFSQKNYYVVVGAFSSNGPSKEITAHLPETNIDTAYAMQKQENLMHFYVFKSENAALAFEKSVALQKAIELQRVQQVATGPGESVAIAKFEDRVDITVKKEAIPDLLIGEPAEAKTVGSASGSSIAAKPAGKLFKFTIRNEEGVQLPGAVHLVDFNTEKDYAAVAADVYTEILAPGSGHDVAAVCGLFGYKQVEKFIDYANPYATEGAYQDESGIWTIPYELKRLEKGDVSVMYNVRYDTDAVVMLPQSQSDLDELVKMMNENANYEITIHSHCNGKHARKARVLSDADNLYSTTEIKQIETTAKELTTLRAESVRHYLLKNGISGKRIKTYAWGGSNMLVSPDSPYANLNDRIEIEIRKD